MPYEAFKSDRIKPVELLKNLKREYVESNQWMPIDDAKEGLVVLCLDPERIRSSRIAANVFPKARIRLQGHDAEGLQGDGQPVLRRRTGRRAATSATSSDLLGAMGDDAGEALESATDEVSAAADNELVKLVNKVIVDAYNQGASDIHIEPYPGQGARPRSASARTARSGPTSRCRRATARRSSRA